MIGRQIANKNYLGFGAIVRKMEQSKPLKFIISLWWYNLTFL